MDSYTEESKYNKPDGKTIINFTDVIIEDSSGQEMKSKPSSPKSNSELFSSMKDHVANFVFQQSKEKARTVYSLYGNIDILRPYFHVEPKELWTRLMESLLPRFSTTNRQVPGELYGPLMLVLTLIALLLYGMKTSGHVREGTLMGTAFAVCFGYWLGASLLVYFVSYVCETRISYLQTLSLMGYALFAHCIVVAVGTAFHSHFLFYSVWCLFGGLSALKMVGVISNRTPGTSQRFLICTIISSFHLLFLLYLHFAYHKTVEVLDRMT